MEICNCSGGRAPSFCTPGGWGRLPALRTDIALRRQRMDPSSSDCLELPGIPERLASTPLRRRGFPALLTQASSHPALCCAGHTDPGPGGLRQPGKHAPAEARASPAPGQSLRNSRSWLPGAAGWKATVKVAAERFSNQVPYPALASPQRGTQPQPHPKRWPRPGTWGPPGSKPSFAPPPRPHPLLQ